MYHLTKSLQLLFQAGHFINCQAKVWWLEWGMCVRVCVYDRMGSVRRPVWLEETVYWWEGGRCAPGQRDQMEPPWHLLAEVEMYWVYWGLWLCSLLISPSPGDPGLPDRLFGRQGTASVYLFVLLELQSGANVTGKQNDKPTCELQSYILEVALKYSPASYSQNGQWVFGSVSVL